jgi:hypothetical protein
VLTAGALNAGIVWPPFIIAAVPVGETKIMLELDESAVGHGIWQNVVRE